MLVYKLVIARVLIFLVIYYRLLRNVIVPPMLFGDSFSRWYVSLIVAWKSGVVPPIQFSVKSAFLLSLSLESLHIFKYTFTTFLIFFHLRNLYCYIFRSEFLLKSLHGGEFTLSIPLIKPNFCIFRFTLPDGRSLLFFSCRKVA